MHCIVALAASLAATAYAQQAGTLTTETHPSFPIQSCSSGGSCAVLETKIVLDANWRYLHATSEPNPPNCYNDGKWDPTICPDGVTCAANCALEGVEYTGDYELSPSGNSLELTFVTPKAVGSRLYLMDTDDIHYKLFKLKNQEFTFDVNASNLPCGLNGALYFVEMDADGGSARYPTNKAGAKYGTGYCDSQCPKDILFIDGEANLGTYGSCCNEMDIWESNGLSSAYTPHPCTVTVPTRCSGNDCSTSCDTGGCDFNPYRLGNESFYGAGLIVDSSKPITVVTQFITADGTATGPLSAIKRFYVQNGKVIPNSISNIDGIPAQNSIDDAWCKAQKATFGDPNTFAKNGGLEAMGQSMDRGQVLVLSLWADSATDMLWLDGTFPKASNAPGALRGTCSPSSGDPSELKIDHPGASVTYSNIKFGDINSTFISGG